MPAGARRVSYRPGDGGCRRAAGRRWKSARVVPSRQHKLAPMRWLVLFLWCGFALAQGYPSKPVKLVSPFRSLGDLIAAAKANPGKLNYPSSGIGTVHHLSGELLNAMAGIDITHVPFRGGASPLTEVLGGRVDLLLEAMTLSIGQIQSGKLRALAVTSRERWKALPNVPTVAATVPGYEVNSFIGLGASGGTPREILERLNAEEREAPARPGTRPRFIDLGGEPGASSPDEMKGFIEREIAKWREVIALRKIERQ